MTHGSGDNNDPNFPAEQRASSESPENNANDEAAIEAIGRFQRWTPDDEPGDVIDVSDAHDIGWSQIKETYAPSGDQVLDQVVEVAKQHGVISVFVERRYIDLDFRSEHSQFYGGTFRRYPSVCHRLHFFTNELDIELKRLGALQMSNAYRGYSVMRPIPTRPVGRTMLSPPPSMQNAALSVCTDEVDICGTLFTVTGVPFISQDQQYSRCSHAALWMVLYLHHLKHRLPRCLPTAIHLATQGGEVHGRDIPSEGLTTSQMLYGLQQLGLSPSQLKLPPTRRGSNSADEAGLFEILIRAVNSYTPAIVIGEQHVWLIVGYRFERSRFGSIKTILIRHDDERGPYLEVKNPWREPTIAHRSWAQAIIPLPQKVYLTGERAEILGRDGFLEGVLGVFGKSSQEDLLADRSLVFRTYAIRSTQFKQQLTGRIHPEIDELYRMTHMPRYIWVVEVIDLDRMFSGDTCCLGETIIDATAHHLKNPLDEDAILSVHVAGVVVQTTLDHDELRTLEVELSEPYQSGCPATVTLKAT
jgi:hypothetical protein